MSNRHSRWSITRFLWVGMLALHGILLVRIAPALFTQVQSGDIVLALVEAIPLFAAILLFALKAGDHRWVRINPTRRGKIAFVVVAALLHWEMALDPPPYATVENTIPATVFVLSVGGLFLVRSLAAKSKCLAAMACSSIDQPPLLSVFLNQAFCANLLRRAQLLSLSNRGTRAPPLFA